MPEKWEIWDAKVKFEDDPDTVKERPVLVIDQSNCFLISLKITSHEPREQYFGGVCDYEMARGRPFRGVYNQML